MTPLAATLPLPAKKPAASTTLIRWLKFNLVGALGMAVQLATLALLSRALPNHLLLTTAAAVELAILHNFLWHLRYTWRDRTGNPLAQLLRFQAANGLISLTGNLALMPTLVHQAHLPVLVANTTAILLCSVANFLISNHWAFSTPSQS
jgi:putative flippase GtrA